MAEVNWSDLQKAAGEAGFDPVPASVYDVIVKTAEAVKTQSGKDMIKVKYRITAGPYVDRMIFNQFVLTTDNANALAFFFRHMAAMGLGKEFFATNPRMDQVALALIERPCRVKVGVREYNGQDRNEVQQVMLPAPGTAIPAPLPTGPVALGPGGIDVFAPAAPAPPMPSVPTVVPPMPAALPNAPTDLPF